LDWTAALSPPIHEAFEDEDFEFLSEEYGCGMFTDLDHLLKRVEGVESRNILAVISDPAQHIEQIMEPGFIFAGYELIEDETGISALSNCGGFPKAFANEELNAVALISDFERAREIQRALSKNYPNEAHAHTMLYAIWRLDECAGVISGRA
jgi:hypothetical protein